MGKNNNQEEKLGQEGPKTKPRRGLVNEQSSRQEVYADERADVSLDGRTMENVAIFIIVTMTALASACGEL
jgi:hypothetical protein